MKDKAAQGDGDEQSGESEDSKEGENKKECLVEELDQEIENDNDEEN
jgi:hypothetical protein